MMPSSVMVDTPVGGPRSYIVCGGSLSVSLLGRSSSSLKRALGFFHPRTSRGSMPDAKTILGSGSPSSRIRRVTWMASFGVVSGGTGWLICER